MYSLMLSTHAYKLMRQKSLVEWIHSTVATDFQIHSGNTLRTDQVLIITPATAVAPFFRVLETAEAPKMTVVGDSTETSPRLSSSSFTFCYPVSPSSSRLLCYRKGGVWPRHIGLQHQCIPRVVTQNLCFMSFLLVLVTHVCVPLV